MGKRFLDDIRRPKQIYQFSSEYETGKLGYYYFLIDEEGMRSGQYQKLITNFDAEGIPINLPYIDVANQKPDYYPITIGQYGLAVFHSYLTTQMESKKEHFLRIANWFYQNHISDIRQGVFWETGIPKPEYKIYKPWKSAFAQSRGLSILLRAWQISDNSEYLDLSRRALIPYNIDIRDGGVTAFRSENHPFYEEYVAEEPTMVLDGHLFSLFGIYDFIRAVPESIDRQNNQLAKQLFSEGIDSFIYWFPKFDLGFWLRFNLCRMEHYPEIDPCTIGYLRLVISQIQLLYEITHREELTQILVKIKQYDKLINKIKMYPLKYRALKKLQRI